MLESISQVDPQSFQLDEQNGVVEWKGYQVVWEHRWVVLTYLDVHYIVPVRFYLEVLAEGTLQRVVDELDGSSLIADYKKLGLDVVLVVFDCVVEQFLNCFIFLLIMVYLDWVLLH